MSWKIGVAILVALGVLLAVAKKLLGFGILESFGQEIAGFGVGIQKSLSAILSPTVWPRFGVEVGVGPQPPIAWVPKSAPDTSGAGSSQIQFLNDFGQLTIYPPAVGAQVAGPNSQQPPLPTQVW